MVRYAVAVVTVIAAVFLTLSRPVLTDTPYIFFLGAIIVTALLGGLGPAFFATALSAMFIRLFFVEPRFSLYHRGNTEDAERLCWFVLVSLMSSSLVAACRRERNLLRDSEERYRILAETASDAIIVIDERGEILFVNPVAENTFGAPAEKLLGQNLGMLLPDDIYQSHLAEIRRHLDTRKKAVAVQLPGRTLRGGKILLEMTLGAFSKHGKNLFTAVLRDITKHDRVEHVHL
jgi:PAS domain S-box-containing protein